MEEQIFVSVHIVANSDFSLPIAGHASRKNVSRDFESNALIYFVPQ